MTKKKDKKSKKFLKDYNPISPGRTRFKLGDIPANLYENRFHYPVFSFHYISLEKSKKSFNNPLIKTRDYHSFLERLKGLSQVSYEQMDQGGISFRFHAVNFDDKRVTVTENDFKKALTSNPEILDEKNTPTLYQFSIGGKQRAFGFLGYYGTFYLVWFDYDHSIYSGKK